MNFFKLLKYIINWRLLKRFGNEKELLWVSKQNYSLVVDVGANHGIYSFALSKFRRNIVCVEPLDDNLKYIKFISKFFLANYFVINKALSNKKCKAELYCTDISKKSTRAQLHYDKNRSIKIQSIETTTLDELLISLKLNCNNSLIKIDVEGHELEVLEGAHLCLNNTGNTWLVEIQPHQNKNYEKVFKLFEKYNYECFIIDTDTNVIKGHDWRNNSSEHVNYIFKKFNSK